jgi:hypothetical protein
MGGYVITTKNNVYLCEFTHPIRKAPPEIRPETPQLRNLRKNH